MTRYMIFLAVMIFSQNLWAERFQPFIESISFAEKIIIRGFKGKLELVPTTTDTLRVDGEKISSGGFDQWTFQVRKKTGAVEIVVKGPSEQEDWDKVRNKAAIPTFNLKILAPVRPVEVYWGEGKVISSAWPSDLSLQMNTGEAQISKGKGALKVQMVKGRVSVAEHEGPVELQTYKGEGIVKGTKGALSLLNHSARLKVSEHVGPLEVANHSGTMNFVGLQGQTSVKNITGVVVLKDFAGSFSGDFKKGALDARVKELQSFVVNSQDAKVTLDAPKESGATVDLRSEKGDLWAPLFLRKVKKGRWRERKGRLKGEQQGQIKIVSKYGDIVLK